jgi:hypothetical protein
MMILYSSMKVKKMLPKRDRQIILVYPLMHTTFFLNLSKTPFDEFLQFLTPVLIFEIYFFKYLAT